MGFFKSWKGEASKRVAGGEEGSQDHQRRCAEKRSLFGHASLNWYGPTSHHPPAYSNMMSTTEYNPPPGQRNGVNEIFAPPPGPPPRHVDATDENPPPYHDWTVIPDTALLPPPPAIHYDYSTNNASWDDAARADTWCSQNPLYSPSKPNPPLHAAVQNGDISLEKSKEFKGDLTRFSKGQWKARTKPSCRDCILLSTLPLYFAAEDSPLTTGRSKNIYFEVRVINIGRIRDTEAAAIAIGFCAKPYPPWRLPGWQRASLGVHGDDGRRFVNDPDGGIDFTRPFKAGETVGLGMTFDRTRMAGRAGGKAQAEVFFTRNGQRDEGWQVHEELDGESDGVAGLEGELDLYAAIGMAGQVEFQVQLAPEGWLYQP